MYPPNVPIALRLLDCVHPYVSPPSFIRSPSPSFLPFFMLLSVPYTCWVFLQAWTTGRTLTQKCHRAMRSEGWRGGSLQTRRRGQQSFSHAILGRASFDRCDLSRCSQNEAVGKTKANIPQRHSKHLPRIVSL